MNRKVLMITYLWPPMEGVGLMRVSKFAKYLPEYGWEPVILTVRPASGNPSGQADQPAGMKVHRTAYKDIIGNIKRPFAGSRGNAGRDSGVKTAHAAARKNTVSSFVREMIAMPDEQIGWYRSGFEEGKRIIEEERVDLIFSTSPPETAHLIGRALKRQSGLPWVADLRDLWSDDHFRNRIPLKKAMLKIIERKVLGDADSLVTVSRPWAERLCASLEKSCKRAEVVENGFDEADFGNRVYGHNEKFTITYTGKLHKEHQDVDRLFKVLARLIFEKKIDRSKIQIVFYILGYDRPDIDAMAARYGLNGIVTAHEKVSYDESVRIQGSSDVLLFVQWRGRGSEGWYSAKLYDYLGARRPILALSERGGIIEDIITRTSGGIIADNETNLEEALVNYYGEYARNGCIKYNGIETEISANTRRQRTADLAGIFDSIISGESNLRGR